MLQPLWEIGWLGERGRGWGHLNPVADCLQVGVGAEVDEGTWYGEGLAAAVSYPYVAEGGRGLGMSG